MDEVNSNILSKTDERDVNNFNLIIGQLQGGALIKWKSNPNKVDFLKYFMSIIINVLSSKSNSSFTDDEKDEMLKECICYYLLIWLENAENARQTVYSFKKQKFALKSTQKRHKTGKDILDVEPDQLTALYRGLDIYNANIDLETPEEKKQSSKFKNFIELCFLDAFSNYNLDLYRYLMYRKKPLQNTTNKKEEPAISKGYNEYFSFLKGLGKEVDNTHFTVKSLFFLKFESTMRFLFAYQIAEYSVNNNIPIDGNVLNNISYYCNRMEVDSCAKGISISFLHRKNEEIIKNSFRTENITPILEKIYNSRIIMYDALAIFLTIAPFSINDDWSNQDFNNASAFLKTDYNILNIFQNTISNIDNSKTQNTIFEQIKTLYLDTEFIEKERLLFARDTLRNKAKKQNSRIKK